MKNKIIGIIVEFNPLHNGHKNLIDTIKNENPNAFIIAAMSGNFVQRGELSIYSKWTRAEYAIEFGVDLVVEIPPFFVLNNANIFAKKSIEILNSFNVQEIYFGSENLDIEKISEISKYAINQNKKLEFLKKKHHSLPRAFEELMDINIKPNDILGICYVMEAIKNKLDIEFKRIERKSNDVFTSASKIRKLIWNNKISKNSLINHDENNFNIETYSDVIIGKLITSKSDVNEINYLQKQCIDNGITSFNELIDKSANKNFTKSRLRRELIKFILELEGSKELIILAATNEGKKILKESDNYVFRHTKENNDNYKVERFISIKRKDKLDKLLSESMILK